MLDFHKYLMRYGEHGVQAIIENIEHNEHLTPAPFASLESRWNRVMRSADADTSSMAA